VREAGEIGEERIGRQLTIRPQRRRRMPEANALMVRNCASRLIAMSRRQSANVISSNIWMG